MASKKVSALTALTSAGTDDLLYIADTSDSGSSYASKRITVGNFLNGYATESYVTTAISNVIDSAPSALDTLNELAAALNDDANFSTTITNLIDANETHIDNVATLTGVAKDSTSLGTFSGSTISDNVTVKAAIQALETAVEAAGSASSLNAATTDISDLQTLTGIADGSSDLGTFSGSTISDTTDIKTALQELETAVEAAEAGSVKVQAVASSTNAVHYLTFVDSNNTSATDESVYTDAGIYYNPFTNQFTANGVNTGVLSINSVDVTATAAELNILDGVTSTATELNILDGVTATTAELNILDGVTATAAELNILDGVTSTAAELNILDGVTSTAAELNLLDGVTATTAELNLLDGVTATTAELNYVDGVTSNIQTQLNGKVATGANVNTLVGSTSAGTVPVDGNGDDNYLFLVINKSNGALTAIDKTFLEAEG